MLGRSLLTPSLIAVWLAGCGTGADAAHREPERKPSLDAPSWPERLRLEQAIAAEDRRYTPRAVDGGALIEAPGIGSARLDSDGAHVTIAGAGQAVITLSAWGRGDGMRAVDRGSPRIDGPEVRTPRAPGVVEWWRSLPSGLEHGVTFLHRPAGEGPLFLEVAISGGLAPRAASDQGVALVDASGGQVGHYGRLAVWDAAGDLRSAQMAVDGGRVRIAIDDSRATYPLVVDPLVWGEEASLVPAGGAAGDRLGVAVSFSADGGRALVGAYLDDSAATSAGLARVFVRSGSIWRQEVVLSAPDAAAGDETGYSVSLSADGTSSRRGVA